MRLATPTTREAYVAGKLWRLASLARGPWHPAGGCGCCRHGTFERVRPPGTVSARGSCPKARRTVSALPDCLASHYSGTLADLEAMVLAVERAPSRAFAAGQLRTEIELPGALRYLDRLYASVHTGLSVIRGLEPVRFAEVAPTLQAFATVLGAGSVLMRLRSLVSRYLPRLPTPFGFDPHRRNLDAADRRRQHRTGPDPPSAFLQAPA